MSTHERRAVMLGILLIASIALATPVVAATSITADAAVSEIDSPVDRSMAEEATTDNSTDSVNEEMTTDGMSDDSMTGESTPDSMMDEEMTTTDSMVDESTMDEEMTTTDAMAEGSTDGDGGFGLLVAAAVLVFGATGVGIALRLRGER